MSKKLALFTFAAILFGSTPSTFAADAAASADCQRGCKPGVSKAKCKSYCDCKFVQKRGKSVCASIVGG